MSDKSKPSPGNPISVVRYDGHVNANEPNPRQTDAPSSDPRRSLGAEGEARAASFLMRRGYRIEARNVRYDGVEIDLIARRGTLVVFVEVKTRRTTRFGPPELAVDRRKQARMIRAALAWLHQHRGQSRNIRFDVIACSVIGNRDGDRARDPWKLEHLVAAFDAGD